MFLFGLWLFDAFPISPPQWLTEAHAGEPKISQSLFLVLLTTASIIPIIWIDTGRLRRHTPLLDIQVMAKIVFTSRRGALNLFAMFLFAGLTAWTVIVNGVPVDSYFVRTNILILCSFLMMIILPPSAIVLASSSFQSRWLLETIVWGFKPLRVITLLDASRLGTILIAARHDNLRRFGGQSWQPIVHRLIDIAPLVIVDARIFTPQVREEIEYMLQPERVRRAVFIINDDRSAPGLQAIQTDWQQLQLHCVFLRQLPLTIANFRSSGRLWWLKPPAFGHFGR